MDPNNPESVQKFNNSATIDAFGLIPVLGYNLSKYVENSLDPEGVANLDNDKMSNAFSTIKDQNKSMTDSRKKLRQQQANERQANYTDEQKRKMKLKNSDNGYQKALRGG